MNESIRNTIVSLIDNDNIKDENIPIVLHETNIIPSSTSWYKFIDQLLLWFGALSLAFAMIFFVAFNWSEFGVYGKFALVELSLILSVIGYLYLDTDKLSSKAMLFVSSILLGALLALFGQTYQTGADTWQLFFYWAILILPWVTVGRFAALWIFWVLLMYLSASLYIGTFGRIFGFYFYSQVSLVWLFFLANTFIFLTWELLSSRFSYLDERWAIRLLALISGVSATWLALYFVLEHDSSVLSMLFWVLWLGGIYYFYRIREIDLFILSIFAFSCSVVIVSALMQVITFRSFNVMSILFIGIVTIGLGAGFASWLKSIHKELNDESEYL